MRSFRNEATSQDGSSRPQDTCLVGLCTGLYAAIAISSAPSLSALIPIAVQMVLVAFRAGLYVTGMAEQLERVDDVPKSWSYVVPEISESRAQEALTSFQESQARASYST
jgi:hypothetical protein